MALHGLSSMVSSALALRDCVAALRGGDALAERRWARRLRHLGDVCGGARRRMSLLYSLLSLYREKKGKYRNPEYCPGPKKSPRE